MLQVIFFAVLLGVALTFLDNKNGQPVVTLMDRIQNAMVVIIHIVMKIAPYGVAALVAEVVGTSGFSVLKGLFVYGLAVLIGLALHGVIVYGLIVKYLAKLPIFGFLRAARPAQLIAFSTSSSSAALPVSMECAEENLGVSNPVASFVIPLGSTVNMDGTALYQGVAAIFIAQVFQMDLSFGDQIGIVATATMASIGAAGVPGAGMVTLAMVLTASGIPTVGVALILGMDRLLDMFRTGLNVTGDLAVTAAMGRSEGDELKVLSKDEDKGDHKRGFERRLDGGQEPIEPE
jgi:Na+/H+-dicarboxylate symporter